LSKQRSNVGSSLTKSTLNQKLLQGLKPRDADWLSKREDKLSLVIRIKHPEQKTTEKVEEKPEQEQDVNQQPV